ncbi:hypothetical protein [Mycobacteroides chelonae]|uniref:hypothetical protein n=1 Tax=Mycobacteroides chelonae TaxID=1774 RepID=UPI0012FFAA61|nr:hypothetical protein [Mycobacteroides chelonae]
MHQLIDQDETVTAEREAETAGPTRQDSWQPRIAGQRPQIRITPFVAWPTSIDQLGR